MRYFPNGMQMKEADERTIQEIGIPSLVLMERAALQSVAALEYEKVDFTNILIICGAGNNGGDGFAIARLLHLKGYVINVVFPGEDQNLTQEARLQKKILENYNIPIQKEFRKEGYSLIIDCIFGIGITREIKGTYYELINKLNQLKGKKISIDIPSGISADTGAALGIAFKADITITIATAKIGLMLFPGAEYAGKIITIDIGIDMFELKRNKDVCGSFFEIDAKKLLPIRKANSHKGSFGKLLVIAGSEGMAGAAYLCAKSAYCVGTGLVQIYTHQENRIILQQLLPEAIISTYNAVEEDRLVDLLNWAEVVVLGPGMGKKSVETKIICDTITKTKVPCVIDADGLNILSEHMQLLEDKEKELILTPHMKEMTRLLKCNLLLLQNNKMEYIKKFTTKYNVTCALKDARTIVAKKNERLYLNISGNAAMAKAGSGDILSGIIGGFLAQKMSSYNAAALGVYVHGLAGDKAKEEKGSYSVLARDIIDNIYKVLKGLEEVNDCEDVF